MYLDTSQQRDVLGVTFRRRNISSQYSDVSGHILTFPLDWSVDVRQLEHS